MCLSANLNYRAQLCRARNKTPLESPRDYGIYVMQYREAFLLLSGQLRQLSRCFICAGKFVTRFACLARPLRLVRFETRRTTISVYDVKISPRLIRSAIQRISLIPIPRIRGAFAAISRRTRTLIDINPSSWRMSSLAAEPAERDDRGDNNNVTRDYRRDNLANR